jgi:hypothetical protein
MNFTRISSSFYLNQSALILLKIIPYFNSNIYNWLFPCILKKTVQSSYSTPNLHSQNHRLHCQAIAGILSNQILHKTNNSSLVYYLYPCGMKEQSILISIWLCLQNKKLSQKEIYKKLDKSSVVYIQRP